jgi:hypothetical protein
MALNDSNPTVHADEDERMRFTKLPVTIDVERQAQEQELIETQEGVVEASEGDVILRGVHGERYPVAPEIFAKTYVPADASDMDAFAFYDAVTPDGVQVLMQESADGEVGVEGVHVDRDDLGPEAAERAVEFARELSRVLDLESPPAENAATTDATSIVCGECGFVRPTTEENPTLASCRECGSFNLEYQEDENA